MIRTIIHLLIMFFVVFSPGCQLQSDNSDLSIWIDEVSKRKGGRIDPLPEFMDDKLVEREIGKNPFEPLVKNE